MYPVSWNNRLIQTKCCFFCIIEISYIYLIKYLGHWQYFQDCHMGTTVASIFRLFKWKYEQASTDHWQGVRTTILLTLCINTLWHLKCQMVGKKDSFHPVCNRWSWTKHVVVYHLYGKNTRLDLGDHDQMTMCTKGQNWPPSEMLPHYRFSLPYSCKFIKSRWQRWLGPGLENILDQSWVVPVDFYEHLAYTEHIRIPNWYW